MSPTSTHARRDGSPSPGLNRTVVPTPVPTPSTSSSNAFASGAPDVTIPLRFMLAGLMSLFLAVGILIARPALLTDYHYHQHIVAVTHLLVLGFLLSVATGATYQLVPVVLETQLHSERLARWHFPIHVLSVAGMVWAFWVWDMKNVGHFGSGLALGVGFFLWNLFQTLRRAPRWTAVSTGIAGALFWLGATVFAGLAISAAKSTYELVGRTDIHPMLATTLAGLKATADFMARFESMGVMHAHAHLGLVGVFVLLTVAVAYRLVPMFLIGEIQRPWRANLSLALGHLGLGLAFFGILLQNVLKPIGAALLAAGLVLYGVELACIVRHRNRRDIDWGLRGFLTSQGILGLTALIGLALSRPGLVLNETVGRFENLYGFLAVFGVLAFAILGMLYKILPFLVWFSVYSREIGRSKTPALHEMYSAPWQRTGYALWLAGLVTGAGAILLAQPGLARLAVLLLAASLFTFARNTFSVLDHLRHPRLQPFPSRRPCP